MILFQLIMSYVFLATNISNIHNNALLLNLLRLKTSFFLTYNFRKNMVRKPLILCLTQTNILKEVIAYSIAFKMPRSFFFLNLILNFFGFCGFFLKGKGFVLYMHENLLTIKRTPWFFMFYGCIG